MQQDLILILDLGSEENSRLARAVRALGVYSEIHPHDISAAELAALPNLKGIILNGGKNRIVDGQSIDAGPWVYQAKVPLLLIDHQPSAQFHSQAPFSAEPSFSHLAAMASEELALKADLEPFLFEKCGAEKNWNMKNFIADQIQLIRRQVGDKKVLLALSGGVDSSVVAALLIKAIGRQLHCVHVNHGLMRKGESRQVLDAFQQELGANLVYVDAADRFLDKLAGVADPEEKRKIIGGEFIRVFEEEAGKLGKMDFLAQGTIYPDVIESGVGDAAVIKSHHNVGGLPDYVDFEEIIEPLRDLFKDEVRMAGLELGLPEELVWRQPFPGPGLAIRVIGDITRDKLAILRDTDFIFRDEIAKAGLHREINQYFTVLTNMRSVGVMGDERTYDYTLALRAVTTTDFMTADWARLPYDLLERVSNRIVNEVGHINRIVYDITSKPPATIEWE